MNKDVFQELRRRQWSSRTGRVAGVVVEAAADSSEEWAYQGYHPNIQRFARCCRSLALCAQDDGPPYTWLAIYPPPLGADGRPATDVTTFGAPPIATRLDTDWLYLDAFDTNGGLVLSVEHGAVLWLELGRASAVTLIFVAPSLESWFQQWLSVDFVEDFFPSKQRAVEGVSAAAYARSLDMSVESHVVGSDAQGQVFSFENASPGDFVSGLGAEATKLVGRLAWLIAGE